MTVAIAALYAALLVGVFTAAPCRRKRPGAQAARHPRSPLLRRPAAPHGP